MIEGLGSGRSQCVPSMPWQNRNRKTFSGKAALRAILKAVEKREGLEHGSLGLDAEKSCALGCFFTDNKGAAMDGDLGVEVAHVNDRNPKATPRQRRALVIRWLKSRIAAAARG